MKRPLLLLVLVAALLGGTFVQHSGAAFNSTSASSVAVATDSITSWLHLYSQSSDPDGLTGYCAQAPGTNPAATGVDGSLAVNLGSRSKASTATCNRVFTIKTPAVFPTGASVTVTASLLADPATGTQPLSSVGFSTVGSGGTFTNPVSLATAQKRQLNLKVRPAAAGMTYRPSILVTVSYIGLTATYYQDRVPVTVTGQ